MTTQELRNEVSALCRTDIAEKDARFISALNLALSTIYAEVRISSLFRIYCSGNTALSYLGRVVHRGFESETLSLSGRAFSMVASGCGRACISDSTGARFYDFDENRCVIRGFLNKNPTLTLTGNLDFNIYHLAVFNEVYSESKEDIPVLDGERVIDMRASVSDFGGFIRMPTDELGNPIEKVELTDGKVYLKSNFAGIINLLYRRIPRRIYIDSQRSEIDLSDEYLPLLPLLCAYYVILETGDEEAKYYKALYDSMISALKKSSYEQLNDVYIDTRGWS